MGTQAVKITKRKDRTLVAVTGPMTVAQASEIKEALLRAFEPGRPVELSLEQVTEIDVTGLQLICSTHRTAMRDEVALAVTGCDREEISSTAQVAGMLRHTGCSQDVSGTCVWMTGGGR